MPILDTDLNVAKQVFDVNFFGVIGTIQAFAPLLIAAEGTIVIIGSAGGVFPYPFGGKPPTFPYEHIVNPIRHLWCDQILCTLPRRCPPFRNAPF